MVTGNPQTNITTSKNNKKEVKRTGQRHQSEKPLQVMVTHRRAARGTEAGKLNQKSRDNLAGMECVSRYIYVYWVMRWMCKCWTMGGGEAGVYEQWVNNRKTSGSSVPTGQASSSNCNFPAVEVVADVLVLLLEALYDFTLFICLPWNLMEGCDVGQGGTISILVQNPDQHFPRELFMGHHEKVLAHMGYYFLQVCDIWCSLIDLRGTLGPWQQEMLLRAIHGLL